MYVPKLYNSAVAAIVIYGLFISAAIFTWQSGGIEATLKLILNK